MWIGGTNVPNRAYAAMNGIRLAESTLLHPRQSSRAGQPLAGDRRGLADTPRPALRGMARVLPQSLMIGAPAQTAPITVRYDLTVATDGELVRIPGVGKVLLHEFLAGRPWTSRAWFRDRIGRFVDPDVLDLFERHLVLPEESHTLG